MKDTVLVIVGPTGSGKSEAALCAAHALNGEVISADSMQVYRGMDIGTAKLRADARESVPHHMIDIVDPDEEFSVADYQRLAWHSINNVKRAGRLPIVCGGSGLHVNSITYELEFAPNAGASAALRDELDRKSPEELFNKLRDLDPAAAQRIHPHNTVRVRRAIEIAIQSADLQKKYDFHRIREDTNFVIVGISPDRALLRERLDKRVDRMVADGLVEEVRRLNERYPEARVLAQGIGYKELRHARNNREVADGVERIKTNTKRFAKRQMTWFRRDPRVVWFEEGKGAMIDYIRCSVPEQKRWTVQ